MANKGKGIVVNVLFAYDRAQLLFHQRALIWHITQLAFQFFELLTAQVNQIDDFLSSFLAVGDSFGGSLNYRKIFLGCFEKLLSPGRGVYEFLKQKWVTP